MYLFSSINLVISILFLGYCSIEYWYSDRVIMTASLMWAILAIVLMPQTVKMINKSIPLRNVR